MCGGSFTGVGLDGDASVEGLDEAARARLLASSCFEFELVDPEITLSDVAAGPSEDRPGRPDGVRAPRGGGPVVAHGGRGSESGRVIARLHGAGRKEDAGRGEAPTGVHE